MEESLEESFDTEKSTKKIKNKKLKYINLTICFLIVHNAGILYQKYLEKSKLGEVPCTKNIFLYFEDICLKLFIIILLCKKINIWLFICSSLYFFIGLVMSFYLIIILFDDRYRSDKNDDNGYIYLIIIYITNIAFFFFEGYLLFLCSEFIEKEKKRVYRKKFGYQNK